MNNAESKFAGPGGNQCHWDTRGMLQRLHVIAKRHRYCGKEVKRKYQTGLLIDEKALEYSKTNNSELPVDETVREYAPDESGIMVKADPQLLKRIRELKLSVRIIAKGAKVNPKAVHSFLRSKKVQAGTAERIVRFMRWQKISAELPA